jgi:drug/metabolite transporter (DMT)-like permease
MAAQSGVVGPVDTVFLGWYFLGEPGSALQLVGVAVVLMSMAMLVTIARTPRVAASGAE